MTIEFKAPEIGPNADALTSLTRGRGPRRGNLEDLLKYWRPIMKKPGGFRRCVVILMDKPQFGGKPQRICAWLHHELTGKWPNEGNHHGRGGKKRKKRRGRSVTRRVRSAGKKSLNGVSPLTEVTSLRMTIRESREFGGILVQPIAGRKNAVEMKAAMFLQHFEPLPLFAGNEVKRVGAFGSSSRLGQAAQAAGSIILPGDLSDIRSPIRSQIYETLTPGAPNIPNARGGRILRSRGRGARNKFRCPPGFEKGGTFTNSEFSTCGAQILGIATSGPGSPTPEANNRLSRLANTAGLVNEIGDLRNNDSAVDIIRSAQIPAAPKKGSPTRAQTSIDLVLTRYEQEDFPTKVVRRDGVILEPVVSIEALGKLNEFDDMADGSLIERYEAGQIGASTVPAFSTNLRNVFVSIPDAGAVQISRVGGEISDAERSGLIRSFATGISRSADLPDPSAAVRAWADGSDGRFTVEFGEVTETGFEVAEDKNDLIKVATAGGKTETVPRWVYETFLSRSAPRRAKDAPIYEIVAEEGAEEKSGSPFAFSQKSAPVATDFTDVLDAKYYHMSINSKIEAFTSLTEIDFKAPRGRGLGRRIGRGGRAVGGRSRAVFDNNLGRYRCPPGTRYGGRFSNKFASNCGYSLPRQIVNNLVDMGIRLEDAMELRRRRRLDTSPGDGRSNLKPETAEKLDDAIRTLDAATGELGRVFEKTEGVEGGRLGRTIGEARRDVDLTPEERQLLEGEALEAALQNLRDVMNDQDLANANLDEIRKAYKAVEKAANTEAGRLSDSPPRTPEQRSRRDGILGFLRELILRLLGLWNEDDERARAGRGRDVVPGDEGVPGGPGGSGPRRPRAPGVPGDGSDSRTPDGRTPDGRTPDGRTPGVPGDVDRPEVTDEDLERILVEFRERAEAFEVAGGGMTVDFVESLDDNDLDRYISAFQLAAERLADDPQFDDINDALNRLLAERERRNRDRSLVNANLRDRFDIETADGLAEAIEHFEDLADQYGADDIMTVDFFERLNDDEIAFFQDVFERAMSEIGDQYEEFEEIFDRLEEERLRRDRLNKKPTMTDDEYKLILKEMNAHLERYQVVGGGKTVDFLNAISDDDLIKYRRAIRDGLEADAFREGEDREKLQELLQRMDAEFDRRFRGPGKRPRIESEETSLDEKFNLDDTAELNAAIAEWQRRAADFEVTGGGMTQNLLEALSDEELAFFEDAHLRLRDIREADGDFELEALNEIIDRLRAERNRRDLQQAVELPRSDPDSRSLRNVNNRFPRNGLPGRAYWRDDDYNGTDAAELDRRFGDYYDADNNLNDRGREVNRRLRPSDPTDPNAGAGGAPEPPDPNDPDVLDRFSDDELRALLEAGDDLPFNLQRISDDDLSRLDRITTEMLIENRNAANLRHVVDINQEYNALQDGRRDPNRLGVNVPGSASNRPQRLPRPLNDPAAMPTEDRRAPDTDIVNMMDQMTPEQIDNLAGAAVREHQDLLEQLVNTAGDLPDGYNFADLEQALLRVAENNPDQARTIRARLKTFRELNNLVDGLNDLPGQDGMSRNEAYREVLREYLPRLDGARRQGILNMRDNPDAALVGVDTLTVDEPFVDININRTDDVYEDASNRFDADPDRFISGLDLFAAEELLERFDARVNAGDYVSPELRAAVKDRYVDMLNINDGDVDDLARRMANLDDAMLDDMSPRDRAIRQARLRGANPAGGPPSRVAVEQADRLRAADRRAADRLAADRGADDAGNIVPDGPINLPDSGTLEERVGAALGMNLVDPDRVDNAIRNLSDDEFDRLYRREQLVRERFEVGTPEVYRAYRDLIADRIDREYNRRRRDRSFQLDRPIQDRDDDALLAHLDDLRIRRDWQSDSLGRDMETIDRLIEEIEGERAARRLRNFPSVQPDLVDAPRDPGYIEGVQAAIADNVFQENMDASDIAGARSVLNSELFLVAASTNSLLRYKKNIQDTPNLNEAQKADLMQRLNRVISRRGDESFERNLPASARSLDALDRHLAFIERRLNEMTPDNQNEDALRTYARQLREQRALTEAGLNLQDAVDNIPSLSDRWRNVARWNFMKARRRRQQQREQKMKEIAETRYTRRRGTPWDIGGHEGLSNMSDEQVKSRIRDTFMMGDKHDPIQVGTVEINGEVFTKQISVKSHRIAVRRRASDNRIREIKVEGHLVFEIVDSDGNPVATEAYDGTGGWTQGFMERRITFDEAGAGHVAHMHLGTNRTIRFRGQNVNFRGGGFTDVMFNNNLIFYRNMGVESVGVSAADDGNIVWPRIGFRDAAPRRIKAVNLTMAKVLEDYDGYNLAKRTGTRPTDAQYAAKALIQDDVRADRVRAMLEPYGNDPENVEAMPGVHDWLLALDGENTRNSVAFQFFRGNNTRVVMERNAGGIRGLDNDMLDELFADEPELENMQLRSPFDVTTFYGGNWDIRKFLTDENGDLVDPRNVSPDLIDPYDQPPEPPSVPSVPSAPSAPSSPPAPSSPSTPSTPSFTRPRQLVGTGSQKMNPEASRGRQRPVESVPDGANGINSLEDAIARLGDPDGRVSEIPDSFVNKAILEASNLGNGSRNRLNDKTDAVLQAALRSDRLLPFFVQEISDADLERLHRQRQALAPGFVNSNTRIVDAEYQKLLDGTRSARRLPNLRFTSLLPNPGGINNIGGSLNGAQILRDNVTGQVFLIKFSDGRSYGANEAANELVGRALNIRLGFAQGQVRLDGPFNPNPDIPANRGAFGSGAIRPTRGLVAEAAHNFLPDGVDEGSLKLGGQLSRDEYKGATGDLLDDMTHMVLGDALMMNTDRHGSNWLHYQMPDGSYRLVPIDMGLGMEGRVADDRTPGDWMGVEGLAPEAQFRGWANGELGGNLFNAARAEAAIAADPNAQPDVFSGERWPNEMILGLRNIVRQNEDRRKEVAASFDKAIARLRAAHEAEDMTDVIQDLRPESALMSDGWRRSEQLFKERYGWLMNSDITGEDLIDALLRYEHGTL